MRPAIKFFIYSVLLLALSPARSFGLDRVVIGNVSRTVEQLPNYAATDKGFFAQEGIQGDVVLIGSTDTLIQALISGQINVAIVDPSAAINAVERGASLKIIGGTVPVAAYTLVTCRRTGAQSRLHDYPKRPHRTAPGEPQDVQHLGDDAARRRSAAFARAGIFGAGSARRLHSQPAVSQPDRR
jgi:ABC-type nitrate/sulfonate/bicarbonate transport system substrate-binding protein